MSARSKSDVTDEPPLTGARTQVGKTTAVGRSEATDCGRATRTIAVLRKNHREAIHVRVIDIGGTSLIDLRVFTPCARKGFEPVPTRSGICLPRAQLRSLIAALQSAEVA